MIRAVLQVPKGLLILLLGLTAGILLAGAGYYRYQRDSFEKAASAQLKVVADLKTAQIVRWRQERLDDANWAVDNPGVSTLARRFLDHPADEEARAMALAMLEAWREHARCGRVLLVDPNLKVRLAVPAGHDWLGARATNNLTATFRTNQVLVTDLHLSEVSRLVNLDLFAPLHAHGSGAVFAVLMFEVDPNEYLFPLIQAWPTPSRSAETLLVRREGDDVVFLNELRHQTNTAMRLRVPVADNPRLAAVQAVQGREEVFAAVDYRRMPVLAAAQSVPRSPWFIVAKEDLAEIDAPLNNWMKLFCLTVALLLLAAVLGVGFIWRGREFQYARQELAARQRAEGVLQHSYSLLEATLESTADGLLVVDNQGNLTRWNRRWVELWRAPEPLLAARQEAALLEWMAGRLKSPDVLQLRTQDLLERPEADSFDILRLKDGRVFERYSHPRRLQGQVAGRVWSYRDVTVHERLTGELERKNEELEHLIYAASHDLRSPLVNIEGFGRRLEKAVADLASLTDDPNPSEPVRLQTAALVRTHIPKSMEYIRAGVVKMNALVNGLLHLSRLGQTPMALRTLDMTRVLQQAAASLAFQVQKAGATLEIEELPPCQGDPGLIGQVFSNLLDNALKYRHEGRPLRVRVSGRREEAESVYCVEDNGAGIPAESRERIWELFHRLQPGRSEPGEGLGLNLVRRILNRHQGRVWVESEAGQGSRFYVALPRAGGAPPP